MELKAVTIREINRIFEVTDELLVDREKLEIPLRPADPGGVEQGADGVIKITVPKTRPLDEWLVELEDQLRELVGL
ncbi:MAG: hypothetical protein KC466_05090 [Myxococcales bacterium]|nr:hypothetical protein [Myxococcales bacterium]